MKRLWKPGRYPRAGEVAPEVPLTGPGHPNCNSLCVTDEHLLNPCEPGAAPGSFRWSSGLAR